MSKSQEQEEDFTFPISSSSSNFIESPRLKWRRIPPTTNSTPITKLELLLSKYQRRRSFSYMENNSTQMMSMMMMMKTHDDQEQDHKMDLLWEDLHEFSNTKKYFNEDNDDSDPDQVGIRKSARDLSLPVKGQYGTLTILKVLKKLFYVRKIGSSRSI